MALTETIAPLAPIGQLVEVTDAEMNQYAELIYRRTGIRVPPQKKTLLSNRVRRRLRETGIQGFGDYYKHLKKLRQQDPEWDAFLQEITTHETFLFRDHSQWEWFRNRYLPQCAAEVRAGSRERSLRIWSAACSTGDEAYTAACCVAACLPNYKQWQIQIVGTDIGVGAVEQANPAFFRTRAMKLVPESYRRRYFKKAAKADVWEPRPALSEMVHFSRHNLLERLREEPFDVVFLKNVLIYFAPESKKQVMQNVSALIRPGGHLVSGPAEGITDLVRDYVRLQSWLHQRPQR